MRLVFDIETNTYHPREVTKLHCIVTQDADTREVNRYSILDGTIDNGLAILQQADELIGHNIIAFDVPALKHIANVDLYDIKMCDTLVLSRLIYGDLPEQDEKRGLKLRGSHALKAWGQRLGNAKDTFGDTADWEVCTQEMVDYCAQDVALNLDLYNTLIKHVDEEQAASVDLEMQVAKIAMKQEATGWLFDMKSATALLEELMTIRADLLARCRAICPPKKIVMKTPKYYKCTESGLQAKTKTELRKKLKDKQLPQTHIEAGEPKVKEIKFNPSSGQHVGEFLRVRYGWKPKLFTDRGAPKIDGDVLDSLPYEEAKLFSEYQMIQKRLSMLSEGRKPWLQCVESDGRIHGKVITLGTSTTRCSHRDPNMSQVTGNHKPYGKECRALFTVPEGKTLVGMDASGLELRCLAHYLAIYDGGEYASLVTDPEVDIHEYNQKAAGLPTRMAAKTFAYAILYGAGVAKIASQLGCSTKEARTYINQFNKSIPALAKLKTTVESVANKRGFIYSIDRRKIHTPHPYKALNYLLQSTGSTLCKKWMCLVDELTADYDVKQIMFSHDELQYEADTDDSIPFAEAAVAKMKDVQDHYGFRCNLDAEYNLGQTWADTH